MEMRRTKIRKLARYNDPEKLVPPKPTERIEYKWRITGTDYARDGLPRVSREYYGGTEEEAVARARQEFPQLVIGSINLLPEGTERWVKI